MKKTWSRFLLFPLVLIAGCSGFFGEKTNPDFLDEPVYNNRIVAYVPIQPVLEGFDRPVDIIAGWDELIYVADAGTEEIISFDQAGRELGRFSIPGLVAIAQDRRLDILASGYLDTVVAGSSYRLPTIYRLSLKQGNTYGLSQARIVKKIVHPFYFKTSTPTRSDEKVKFTGIAPLANNRYYLSRTGTENSPTRFGGPDDALLVFDANDVFTSPIQVSTPLGALRDFFRAPSAVIGMAQPPQTPQVNSRGDFYFAGISSTSNLKVQKIEYLETDGGSSYEGVYFPVGDTSKADGFLYTANRFAVPADITFTGDGTNYLFVVDAEKDSLYQFNAQGYEGVTAPRGSNSTRPIKVSFGGTGTGLTQFNEPRGVAYFDKVLYVADTGNKRILRFKLTTDFN